MPTVTIAAASSTHVTVTIDGEALTFKKCYCSTAVDGDYLLFFAHEVETNAFRQQYAWHYSDVTDPAAFNAAGLKTAVDKVIGAYGIVDLAYLAYVDTTTQTNDNTVNYLQYNTKDWERGITIIDGTEITFDKAGKYNIQFSAQVEKTDSGKDDVEFWLVRNGNNVANSSTMLTLSGNNDKSVAAWNWLVNVAANDAYQIAWYSADAEVQMHYRGTAATPTRPAVPSVILTVHQVEGGNS